MTKQELEIFKNRLLEEREKVLNELGELSEQLKHNLKDSNNNDSGYSVHLADAGTDMMEREKTFLFASAEGRLLVQIEDALARLHRGEYGNCELCGRQINPERLEAIPYTQLCISCKRKMEA